MENSKDKNSKKEYIKKFLTSCHEAKRISELMPVLPAGIKPNHIRVIDIIFILNQEKEYVKVSDISETLNVTKPSITKLINELEKQEVVEKNSLVDDKRIATLKLTSLGKKYYDMYVNKYQNLLADLLVDVKEENIVITIKTINKIYSIMKNGDEFNARKF